MRASIYQSNVRRLHECVDKNNLENAFVLSSRHMLTVLRRGKFWLR